MSTHPLSTSFSVEERDRLLSTIHFSTAPRKYHLHSAEFPSMAHIINYSLLYEALSENQSQRSKLVTPSELKNGDILQLTDYRECDTYFCLWLAKDLFPQDLTKYLQKLENDDNDASEVNVPSEEIAHSFTSLPCDVQVDFRPTDVPTEASTDVFFPHRLPREDVRVGGQDGGEFHLYVFSHLDEYGFGGTTATSMAYPDYFHAIKAERASYLMVDPLLVHSRSCYGQLLQLFKEQVTDYQANPCFPVDYIAQIDQLKPAAWNPDTNSYNKTEMQAHLKSITLIPIDMAASVLATGGSASSTVTTHDLETLVHLQEDSPDLTDMGPIHSLNLFYEIRNMLYQHLLTISRRSETPAESLPSPLPSPLQLPLYNEEYIRFPDRLSKFFITSTAIIYGDPFAHESATAYYVERPYEAFVRRLGHRYRSEIIAELDAADPSKASSAISLDPTERVQRSNAIYKATTKRAQTAWATVSEDEKQAVNEIIAKQQEEATIVDRDLSAYRVYRQAQRAALWTSWVRATTETPHRTWFQGELFILQSWMNLSEAERAPYRHQQSEEEARAQIRQDADGILRALRMGKFQHRIYAGVRNGASPRSAIGDELTKTLAAIHQPDTLSPVPEVVQEPEFVFPPSYFTFARVQRQNTTSTSFPMTTSFASNASASTYRPPPGFIAFVFDSHHDLSRQEYLWDDEGLEEIARRWLSLVAQSGTVVGQDTMQTLVAREAELEAIGNAQMAARQQQRDEYNAKRRQNNTTFGGFGQGGTGTGGFGGFSGGSSLTAAPSAATPSTASTTAASATTTTATVTAATLPLPPSMPVTSTDDEHPPQAC